MSAKNEPSGRRSIQGWPGAFRILRLYLTHFRGQRSALMQFQAPVAGTVAEACHLSLSLTASQARA